MSELRHSTHTPWSSRIYWEGDSAGHHDSATRCVVKVSLGAYSSYIEFAWPDESNKVENLEVMLEYAFKRGDDAARKEIREALGVKDPQ